MPRDDFRRLEVIRGLPRMTQAAPLITSDGYVRKVDFRPLSVTSSLLEVMASDSGGPTHHFRRLAVESDVSAPEADFRQLLVTFGQACPKVTSGQA